MANQPKDSIAQQEPMSGPHRHSGRPHPPIEKVVEVPTENVECLRSARKAHMAAKGDKVVRYPGS